MNKTHFEIHGQRIQWSFFWRVVKKYGLRKAQEVFYQCRDKKNIRNYISAGMKHEWFSTDIDRTPHMESFILAHFDKNIPKEKKRSGKQKVESLSDIIGRIV